MVQDLNEGTAREDGEVAVTARPAERQAVEVKPMRYVLGISLALVVVGMAVSYMSF
ncbi:MAG TPA: hypothetical protein VLA00_18830 [Xanthobacteraceae bacterium]|nr:hypothetical protein [Xanthobacteraceae bacterium]